MVTLVVLVVAVEMMALLLELVVLVQVVKEMLVAHRQHKGQAPAVAVVEQVRLDPQT
jgi:hypothetical protein